MLTAAEIASKAIVRNAVPKGQRATTYDATVGTIIYRGKTITKSKFKLPPRGIVWVVSSETFVLPDDVTGLATLKTTWTHEGVLALNVGVVDPGWDGPLAATLVNFGTKSFVIKKGEPFFRILFHPHAHSNAVPVVKGVVEYEATISDKSRNFSQTFLDMDSLADDISNKILKLPKWAIIFTILALVLSILAITLPIGFSVWTDYKLSSAKMDMLQKQLDDIKANPAEAQRIADLEKRVNSLNAQKTVYLRRQYSPRATPTQPYIVVNH